MKFKIPLWKHQERAMLQASHHRDFAFLMDMGTGKTATTINTLRERFYRHHRLLRTLILCPVVVCENWKREFEAHSSVAEKVFVLIGTQKERIEKFKAAIKKHGDCIFVANYEALNMKDLYDHFLAYQFEIAIADESQRIKNPKAKRTQLAIRIADHTRYRYILTGTPILNNPMDIFAQYRFLDKGETFGANFFSFRARYFYDKNAGMPKHKHFPDWRPHPDTEKIFNNKIYKKAIRVMKDECLDLPPLVRQRVEVPLSKEQERVYASMHQSFIAYIKDSACVAELAITKSLRLQQIISGFVTLDEQDQEQIAPGVIKKMKDNKLHRFDDVPRLKALLELIEDLPHDSKFIIWCSFRDNYRMIWDAVEKLGINCVYLTGGLTQTTREKAIESFQEDPLTRCMIANQGAGGVGVNLTAASYAIYYSRNFNLEYDLQSEARCHRGGSEIHKKITRIDLVAPGTIDEQILNSLEKKQSAAEAILEWRKSYES
jgi:SNF2 family DNA or RNA helicase